MKLWLKNLFRRLRGKPPVTDIYFDENLHRSDDDVWNNIELHNKEAILVVVEYPRKGQDTCDVKCFAKISDNNSILIRTLPDILGRFWDPDDDGET